MSEYSPLVHVEEEDASDEPLGPVSGLWRSEEMCLLSVRFEIPLLDRLLHRLGGLGCAEFRDINKGGVESDAVVRKAREFKDKLRACENIERKLKYFEELYPRYPLKRGHSSPSRVRSQEGGGWKQGSLGVPAFEAKGRWWDEADALSQIEKQIQEEERSLRDQQVASIDANLNDYCKLLEQEAVLTCLQTRELHMDAARDSLTAALPLSRHPSGDAVMSKVHGDDATAMRSITSQGTFGDRGGSKGFGSLVGTIEADQVLKFRRLVDRVSKRNAVVVITNPSCSKGGSMDLYQLHRTCVIESRGRSGELSPSAGDQGGDALADIGETSRVDQEICGFMIYFSSNNVMQRLLRLCSSLAGGRLHFINPITTPGVLETPASVAKRYNVELLPQEDLTEAILERRTRAKEKLVMTNRLVDSVVVDLCRLQLHADERKCYILKAKAVYAAVANMQMSSDGVGEIKLDAQLWVPRRKKHRVEDAIADVLKGSPSYCTEKDIKEAKEGPPTWFETNVFTETFQGIVDSYGVPRYQETNPAIWTIITFPWLFGIMYGDIGHGIMIAVAAALMILYENKFLGTKQNEIVEMVFGARWLLFLMGLFAIYIGFIYNDTFGMMLEFSPSRYKFPDQWEHFRHDEIEEYQVLGLNGTLDGLWDGNVYPICGSCSPGEFRPRTDIPMYDWDGSEVVREVLSCPYTFSGRTQHSCATPLGWGQANSPRPQATMTPNDGPTPFGVDVAWSEAENKLDFYNSFKMKNAVIIGIVQMTLGLVLSLCNYIHRKDWNRILFGFIPEVIFLFGTFGYMAVMIIIKWNTEWSASNTAPNVLESMTNFFLSPGVYTEFDNSACHDPNNTNFKDCSGYQILYEGQMDVQVILVILAFAVLPLMLVPIPVITWRKKKAMSNSPDIEEREAAEEIDMQEVVIKQVIHVIEYVLGTVSNTASYLRLWALSLAHAELSEVFLNYAFLMLLEESEGVGGGFMMYAAFGVWLSVTFGVLIVMEALSAFLHALRLHWVEFQNKFYVGDGRAFEPLCFRSILETHGISAKSLALETRF